VGHAYVSAYLHDGRVDGDSDAFAGDGNAKETRRGPSHGSQVEVLVRQPVRAQTRVAEDIRYEYIEASRLGSSDG